jgi:lysozyme family protein
MIKSVYAQRKSLYNRLWNTAILIEVAELDAAIDRMVKAAENYIYVGGKTRVPAVVIALIHLMECDCDFTQHFYNGDPLDGRTINEPKGQPEIGNPPFTWRESAIGALKYDGLTSWQDWSIPGICYALEGYNGWGYVPTAIYSPYLWSCTQYYSAGKFTSDGVFDRTAVSQQCGAMAILKRMVQRDLVQLIPFW